MSDFYYIKFCKYNPYYAELDPYEISQPFKNACYSSQFQYIDPNTPIRLITTKESPEVYADIMYRDAVPIISNYTKSLFDEFGIDNLLYKKVKLIHPISLNEHECWLALPPIIDCLNYDLSEFLPFDEESVEKPVIDENRIGRYDIFKIAKRHRHSASSTYIMLSERLYDFLINAQEQNGKKLEGVYINKL